ncbi:MAG: hypothetical protein ACK2T6_01555 [Anaerolineae bacterium]
MVKPFGNRAVSALLPAAALAVAAVTAITSIAACGETPSAVPALPPTVEEPALEPPAPKPTESLLDQSRVEISDGIAVLSYHESSRHLVAGDVAEIGGGAQIAVAEVGRAHGTLLGGRDSTDTPSDFLWLDLPRRVDVAVNALDGDARTAELRMAGTGRVTLAGSGEAAVLLETDVFQARLDGGPADVVVVTCVDPKSAVEFPAALSPCPGEVDGGWVAVAFGSVEVTDASPTAAVAAESLVTQLAKGQAAAFAADGTLLAVLDLGVAAIEGWYTEYLAGGAPPVAALPTATPTASATVAPSATTPVAGPVFAAGAEAIARGECTTLDWRVPGVTEVLLDGEPQVNPGRADVCPKETTTYILSWTSPGGEPGTLEITVRVSDAPDGGDSGAGGGDSSGGSSGGDGGGGGDDGGDTKPPPYPTRTPCATREVCPIASVDPDDTPVPVPTSAPPASAPPPTGAPPTSVPPTDLPPTQAPPPPTDPPSSPAPATEPP